MLTFFRRIRKGLLDKGAARKYLLYAAGEVLLVMVGILLALQVNNWNEWRKDRVKETKILKDVAENLASNINTLNQGIRGYQRDDLSSEIIISRIENNLPYHDSLDNHFASAMNMSSEGFVLSFVGYESMKNTGFDIVRNDELKKEIISLFELTYGSLQNRINRIGQSYDEVGKLKHEHLMRKSGFRFAPFDFESLVQDQEFLSWLLTIKNNRGWINASREKSLEETQRVLQLIKDELGESPK